MRCPRCQFENMPGLDRCFQCGSALQAGGETVEIQPPRMAGWKRPIRNLFRRARGVHVFPQGTRIRLFPAWLRKWTWEGYLGIFLSLIPGLAHAIQKRFGTIRTWIWVWAGMVLLALFFYGGFWGMMFLGMGLGIHAWIACHAGFFREHESVGTRMLAVVLVSIGLFVLYSAVGRILFVDIVGGYSGVTVPWHRVETRDFLLARRSLARPEALTRGSLVALHLMSVGRNPTGYLMMGREVAQVGQIIGLPGERLELENDHFSINGRALDPEKYPVPLWLKNHSLSTTIPSGSYFCVAEFRTIGYRAEAAIRACTIPTQQIEAKVVLRWHPIRRRGWLRDIE